MTHGFNVICTTPIVRAAPRPAFAQGDVAYVYVCFAALAFVWLLDVRITSSKAGRAIKALRDSERVAASWGIDVTGYKLLAFVVSGSVAGLAGALFASIEQIVSNLTFSFTLSLTFVFMAVLGGVGSRVGVVLGAVVLGPMPFVLDRIKQLNPGFPVDGSATQLITALLLLLVLLWFRGGIAQIIAPIIRWCSFGPWRSNGSRANPASMSGGGDSGRP
jgi:branched-chain amino acid transport system permease protein